MATIRETAKGIIQDFLKMDAESFRAIMQEKYTSVTITDAVKVQDVLNRIFTAKSEADRKQALKEYKGIHRELKRKQQSKRDDRRGRS